jgi:magnesium chelatase accessory protein
VTAQSPLENAPPAHWPLREASQFVHAAGWRWHVQRLGTGPQDAPWLLLLHGTGGSTHEWAEVARLLLHRGITSSMHVLLCDLPGHGFTTRDEREDESARGPSDYSLVGMTEALHALLERLRHESERASCSVLHSMPDAVTAPLYVAGHSAGAAVALQLAGRQASAADPSCRYRVAGVLGVNPALVPPPAAMVHGILPWLAPLTASPVTRDVVQTAQRGLSALPGLGAMQEALGQMALSAILDSTASSLTEASRAAYRTLFAESRHVWSAMQMMAHWDLPALLPRLASVSCPVTLLVARDDPWIPVRALEALHRAHPTWGWRETTGGHLLPEASPLLVSRVIAETLLGSPTP